MTERQGNRDETIDEFKKLVNLTPEQLEEWLESEESQSAGQHKDGGESTGHASGRRIVDLLRTSKSDLSDGDIAHMHKVTGYIKRHRRHHRTPAGRCGSSQALRSASGHPGSCAREPAPVVYRYTTDRAGSGSRRGAAGRAATWPRRDTTTHPTARVGLPCR